MVDSISIASLIKKKNSNSHQTMSITFNSETSMCFNLGRFVAASVSVSVVVFHNSTSQLAGPALQSVIVQNLGVPLQTGARLKRVIKRNCSHYKKIEG